VRKVLLLGLICVTLDGCQYPRDPEGTLDRVSGGVMHVGISESDPWVRTGASKPGGVEVELLERFARTIDARIEWVEGSESDLIEALEGRKLDVVAAGLDRRSEWQRVAALTRPYLTTKVVIAAPDEATADALSSDLGGRRIAVEANSPEASKLSQDTDAIPREVDDPAEVGGPVVVDDFMLDELGLVATDAELDEHEHCLAVSLGENAFLVKLERFLLDREHEASQILEQEWRP
jgi:polar amino acid transport system substrate-binding protein